MISVIHFTPMEKEAPTYMKVLPLKIRLVSLYQTLIFRFLYLFHPRLHR